MGSFEIMPKKTAYSRSGAQRSKTKQKSFELVRPVSTENKRKTAESSEEAQVVPAVDTTGTVDTMDAEETTETTETGRSAPEVEEVEEKKVETGRRVRRRASVKVGASEPAESEPEPVTVAASAPAGSGSSPKSASARLAARRQAAQKAPRSTANLIVAENYGYVRKDLIFILILAVIMFSAIIALHFILG